MRHLLPVAVCLSLLGTGPFAAVRADPGPPPGEELADRLARLDATVGPAGERKALAGMVADALRRRRQELNDRSTAAWQAIRTRDDWEKFRRPKLTALRESLGQFLQPAPAPDGRVTGTHTG